MVIKPVVIKPVNSDTTVIPNTDTGCLTQHGSVVTDVVYTFSCINSRDSIELVLAAHLSP